MTEVQTVQGPIDDRDLGIVRVHEHLWFRDEAVAATWPSRYDSEAETATAITVVTAARERGVPTTVGPTAMLGGRDVNFSRHLAEATGVRIIPCTGISHLRLPTTLLREPQRGRDPERYVEDIERASKDGHSGGLHQCAAGAPGVDERVGARGSPRRSRLRWPARSSRVP